MVHKRYRAKISNLSEEQREILKLLRKLWERNPEQRLGQILENYIFIEGQRGDITSNRLFYQDDKRTLTVLEVLLGIKTKIE
jgi:mRNA-degrading endonuclease RelE of RelBE toxin-antitoxin system